MSYQDSESNQSLSEIVILNELIFNKYARDEIVEQLTEEHFTHPIRRAYFAEAVQDLKDGNELLTEKWIKRFPSSEVERRIASWDAVQHIKDEKTRKNIRLHANEVIKALNKEDSIESISKIVETLKSSFEETEIIKDKSIKELMEGYGDMKDPDTIPWGLESLHKYPLEAGNLVIIGARPSIGKTSLACTLLLKMAENNVNTGIINLEMTDRQIIERLLSQASDISYADIRSQLFSSPMEVENFNRAKHELQNLEILTASFSNCTARDLRKTIKFWVERRKTKVVFIDYLQKIRMPKAERHDLGIGFLTSMLKDLAKDLKIAIVLLVQVNRDAENAIPRLNNLKDSGRIEEDADIVLLLHRDRESTIGNDPLPVDSRQTKLFIEKNRNGSTGVVDLQFIPRLMSFFGGNK